MMHLCSMITNSGPLDGTTVIISNSCCTEIMLDGTRRFRRRRLLLQNVISNVHFQSNTLFRKHRRWYYPLYEILFLYVP